MNTHTVFANQYLVPLITERDRIALEIDNIYAKMCTTDDYAQLNTLRVHLNKTQSIYNTINKLIDDFHVIHQTAETRHTANTDSLFVNHYLVPLIAERDKIAMEIENAYIKLIECSVHGHMPPRALREHFVMQQTKFNTISELIADFNELHNAMNTQCKNTVFPQNVV